MAIYVNKDLAKKYLSNASEDQFFYLSSGQALKNIYELRDYFSNMDQSEYDQYVSKTKNDFASWVLGVFGNKRLETGLVKARTPKEARLYTNRNIKMLERNIRE